MKIRRFLIAILFILTPSLLFFSFRKPSSELNLPIQGQPSIARSYWLSLSRSQNKERLFLGQPGIEQASQLVKTFRVKVGIPGQRPTPLPNLMGRDYWLITDKVETPDSLETAPYFLALDVPYSEDYPFGPTPYLECGGQCDWVIPGSFGLHGVAGDLTKLSDQDAGSSGCIRHSDEDISYLYQLLDPANQEIRYYITD